MLGIQPTRRDAPAGGPEISVVVPVHNESGNISVLIDRLSKALASYDHEIVFVDDGSRDDSFQKLKSVAAGNDRLRVLSLSRNFGHQVAVTAGLEHTRGRAIVIIDADLQDPPEVIPEMVAKWKEGFDVVYGQRAQRDGETWMKRATAKCFYRVIDRMTNFSIPVDTGDFRLVSRRAADAFLAMPERHRFVRGMFSWIGFKQTGVLYHRAQRNVGRTSYTYTRMVRLALDGITSFSNVPLHLATYLGFAAAAIGFVLILWSLYQKFYGIGTMKGWTSLSVIVLFIGGVQLFVIGVLGQYIGRMQDELKRRPLYVIQESVNT
jgi:dolichol-phosphate mannosyltransferase